MSSIQPTIATCRSRPRDDNSGVWRSGPTKHHYIKEHISRLCSQYVQRIEYLWVNLSSCFTTFAGSFGDSMTFTWPRMVVTHIRLRQQARSECKAMASSTTILDYHVQFASKSTFETATATVDDRGWSRGSWDGIQSEWLRLWHTLFHSVWWGWQKSLYFNFTRGVLVDHMERNHIEATNNLTRAREFAEWSEKDRQSRVPPLTKKQKEQLQSYLKLVREQQRQEITDLEPSESERK